MSFLTCQMSFKIEKIRFRKQISDKSLSKIHIEMQAQRKKNSCSEKKEAVAILSHNKTRVTQGKYGTTILKYLLVKNCYLKSDEILS